MCARFRPLVGGAEGLKDKTVQSAGRGLWEPQSQVSSRWISDGILQFNRHIWGCVLCPFFFLVRENLCSRGVSVSLGANTTARRPTQQTFLSLHPGGWKAEISVSAGLILSEASLLACRHHPLPTSARACPSLCVCVLISSVYKDTSHVGRWLP